ncbi:MAG: cytochrome b5 domain-containing protein [Actinobacteria bacterium]|nr:cytochrome b5 domain-containing protein [Actinomycetota bacterium]
MGNGGVERAKSTQSCCQGWRSRSGHYLRIVQVRSLFLAINREFTESKSAKWAVRLYGFAMKKLLVLVIALAFLGTSAAQAHQPVDLLKTDTTAAKGPLLVDGTISFAVRAAFVRAGERRAFRAAFKSGDQFSIQYLIVDKKPENALRTTALPTVLITSPTGKKTTMKITERTKFYEPYGATNYLYLARNLFPAEAGIYSVLITGRGKAEITVAIGDKEIPGEVVRGALPTPTVKTSPTPTPTPTPSATTKSNLLTLDAVRQNNSEKSCWTIIDGYVYDLTMWIKSHPGGEGAIKSLCGKDGSADYKSQHSNQRKPEQRLESYLLGPLSKP